MLLSITEDIKKFQGHLQTPNQMYKEEWLGWSAFLGIPKRQYLSYTELQKQVQALGIKSAAEYKRRYKEISEAPSKPCSNV